MKNEIETTIECISDYRQNDCDVLFDVEVDAEYITDGENEWVPDIRDFVEFIISEIRCRAGKYMISWNKFEVKEAYVFIIVLLLTVSAAVGIAGPLIEERNSRETEEINLITSRSGLKDTARKAKKDAVTALNSDVLGTWYEFDISRDDIREMTLEVEEDGSCVYSLGEEKGGFIYSNGILSLFKDEQTLSETLQLDEDHLANESNGVNYYRSKANMDSLKFSEFLKTNLPGTYQEFLGDYLIIYPDGKWFIDSPWVDDKSGTWSMEIYDGNISVIFSGLGTHFGGGNLYKVAESDYEGVKAAFKSGDFALRLDINNYKKISDNLP